MRFFTTFLLSTLLTAPAFAQDQDAPPRLSTLSAPLTADLAEERQMTAIGHYEQTLVRQLQLKAGAHIPAHAAPTRALVIVLNGRGHFDFSGEIVPLQARQVLHMQPGELHAVMAETDLELLVIRLPVED